MAELLIGIVKNGAFKLVSPRPGDGSLVRLTTTSMQDSVPPENGELNLLEYEDIAIGVEGHPSGDWIYSASVIDTGDPIVTALVENVFGR
ncbi:MAG: hypothetical protein L3J49_14375 [Desulfobulbaceae bacterium]|nr:hypothetical protein [Desulfobulbaceae bacterium]